MVDACRRWLPGGGSQGTAPAAKVAGRVTAIAVAGGALACLAFVGGCTPSGAARVPELHGARLAAVVEDVARMPTSTTANPPSRINYLCAAPDGSHRIFVGDMRGAIRIVADGVVGSAPFLDMATARKGRFESAGLFEQGLSTFAFHPDFAKPGSPGFGRLYTFATERSDASARTFRPPAQVGDPAHDDVIVEWRVDSRDPNRVDPGSAREVMRIPHPKRDHVGGQLAFNPAAGPADADHGKLYIGVGDGGNTVPIGNQVDAWRTAQDRTSPLGKILRIDPLPSGQLSYGVPRDNPYVGDAGVLPEIWALGLRNPQRFSWDAAGTHKMLIADIGQHQLEEIDVGEAGANYGWSEREATRMVMHGDETHRMGLPIVEFAGYTYPALVYGRHLGVAVSGGHVYRGTRLPQLRGMYVFGDIASGRIFFTDVDALANGRQAVFYELPLRHQGREKTLKQIVGAGRADLRFGIDDAGEIYVLTKQDGMVRRLAALAAADTSIRPVENPIDAFEVSWWDDVKGRLEATGRALLARH